MKCLVEGASNRGAVSPSLGPVADRQRPLSLRCDNDVAGACTKNKNDNAFFNYCIVIVNDDNNRRPRKERDKERDRATGAVRLQKPFCFLFSFV